MNNQKDISFAFNGFQINNYDRTDSLKIQPKFRFKSNERSSTQINCKISRFKEPELMTPNKKKQENLSNITYEELCSSKVSPIIKSLNRNAAKYGTSLNQNRICHDINDKNHKLKLDDYTNDQLSNQNENTQRVQKQNEDSNILISRISSGNRTTLYHYQKKNEHEFKKRFTQQTDEVLLNSSIVNITGDEGKDFTASKTVTFN